MHTCLTHICKRFETFTNFLTTPPSMEEQERFNRLFDGFLDCFYLLKEEKLQYPKEFVKDVHLLQENNLAITKKFEDIQIRYLMLSDFYDFVRIKKLYRKSL